MSLKPTLTLLVLTLLTPGCANLERSRDLNNPDVSARTLALQVCSACHGIDGNSVSPAYPRLAQQTTEYLGKQLNDFRAKGRSDPAGAEYMWGLSRHLSDAQIAGLADYYAAQVARPGRAAAATPALLARGQEIFASGIPDAGVMACASCHGSTGEGQGVFPRLRYQSSDYIQKQLAVFQGKHGRTGTPMDVVAPALTPEIEQAVSAWLEAPLPN